MKSLLFQSEKSALGFEGSSLSLQSVEKFLDPLGIDPKVRSAAVLAARAACFKCASSACMNRSAERAFSTSAKARRAVALKFWIADC